MGSVDSRRLQYRQHASNAENCHNGEKEEDHRSYLWDENADARHLAGHAENGETTDWASDTALDLLLQGLDLLLHSLEARMNLKRLAICVQRVLVVADVLHDEAKA